MGIGILLAVMLASGVASAQEPSTCDPSQRGIPGDITTPCVVTPEFEVERVELRFTPVTALGERQTYCHVEVVAIFAEGYILPRQFLYHVDGWYPDAIEDDGSGELILAQGDYRIDSPPSAAPRFGSVRFGSTGRPDSVPVRFTVGIAPNNAAYRTYRYQQRHHVHTADAIVPVDEFYSWESRALKCQAEAHQGHLTLKHTAAEAQRAAAQASANAIAEATAAAEEERAKITAATSAEIDVARLESEKRVTATEARELAVVEEMIQASIKVAAEITQIRIDRATARLESLERTATWLRDAAATDLDEWNTFYKEVEQETITRVEALQVEAAAALDEVQQIQDSLAADLAASVARQQALTLQLQSQGGVSVEDLQILRQNAVDWLSTIDSLIEEAESAGE